MSKKTTISQESMSTLHKNLTFIACTLDVLHPSRAYMLNVYIYIHISGKLLKQGIPTFQQKTPANSNITDFIFLNMWFSDTVNHK